VARLALATTLLLVAVGAAEPETAPGQSARSGQRLDLGLYGSPYGPPSRELTSELRFEAWMEVVGQVRSDPNQTMAFWWRHFDFEAPAIYGRDYNLRPNAQPNAVNILPLLQKAYDKLRKRK